MAIAIEWRSTLAAEALRDRILAHVHRQTEPELADIVIVRSAGEMERVPLQPYARPLLQLLLGA